MKSLKLAIVLSSSYSSITGFFLHFWIEFFFPFIWRTDEVIGLGLEAMLLGENVSLSLGRKRLHTVSLACLAAIMVPRAQWAASDWKPVWSPYTRPISWPLPQIATSVGTWFTTFLTLSHEKGLFTGLILTWFFFLYKILSASAHTDLALVYLIPPALRVWSLPRAGMFHGIWRFKHHGPQCRFESKIALGGGWDGDVFHPVLVL